MGPVTRAVGGTGHARSWQIRKPEVRTSERLKMLPAIRQNNQTEGSMRSESARRAGMRLRARVRNNWPSFVAKHDLPGRTKCRTNMTDIWFPEPESRRVLLQGLNANKWSATA